jgi:hypothetical protein
MRKEQLIDLMFLHLRNLWAVDGIYFLEIEKKFGTENALRIDEKVWSIMGKLEARRLKELLKLDSDADGKEINNMLIALKLTSWSLDLECKNIDIHCNKVIMRNTNCRVQNTRLKKGLNEFPCKPIRLGFLKSFAKEFSSDIIVKCNVCPPDKHPTDLWCEWEFTLAVPKSKRVLVFDD